MIARLKRCDALSSATVAPSVPAPSAQRRTTIALKGESLTRRRLVPGTSAFCLQDLDAEQRCREEKQRMTYGDLLRYFVDRGA